MNATYTQDTSNRTARMVIRGYFSGDGQHSIRVWDRRDGYYLFPYFASVADAIDYVERHGYAPE